MSHLAAAVLAFAAMFALDFAFAKYTAAIVANSRFGASALATVIMLCNAVLVLSYVASPWTIGSAALGAFAGTWFAMRAEAA